MYICMYSNREASHLIIQRNVYAQVYDILQHIQYGEDADQVGIAQLLCNNSFSNAFPLHDVSHTLYCYI